MLARSRSPWSLIGVVLALSVVLLGAGCATSGSPYKGDKERTEHGYASWYGPGFHGKRAANGEVYDMNKLTAAHRTLPFDTVVQVHNRDNGRRVEVRITDRGPFVKGRIIDLSYQAAKQLEMLGPGVVPVEIRVVSGGPASGKTSDYWVQAGAFREADEAEAFYRQLRQDFRDVKLSTDGHWHRVRLGPFAKRQDAKQTQHRLERRGIETFLLRL